jgi:hypothetical protein
MRTLIAFAAVLAVLASATAAVADVKRGKSFKPWSNNTISTKLRGHTCQIGGNTVTFNLNGTYQSSTGGSGHYSISGGRLTYHPTAGPAKGKTVWYEVGEADDKYGVHVSVVGHNTFSCSP